MRSANHPVGAASLAIVLACLDGHSARAFTSLRLQPSLFPTLVDSTRLHESTLNEENGDSKPGGSWSIAAPRREVEEAKRKKQVATDALKKLLDRQQRDVQQTLDLLEHITIIDEHQLFGLHENDMLTGENVTEMAFNLSANPMTASIASGVDYGFISRSEGCRVENLSNEYLSEDLRFEDYGPPGNVWELGSQQFMRNLRAMVGEYRDEVDNPALTPRQKELQAKLGQLTLNSTAIWERERARGEVVAPLVIKFPYYALCFLLDVVFEGRNAFSRFFLLETVARMPYFSYITMLHLYESLGFWRRSSDIKRIHFAEEWNEFHHLLIMESMGGDQPYWVRFLAQHSAVAYYVALCLLWIASPSLSYKFSEMLETHAVDTYGQFVDENESKLKELPPSLVAVEYYTIGLSDPMFGEYQTASVNDPHRGVRKPGLSMNSLYDVFCAIRNDEGDHVQTMSSCLDPKVSTLSPALESRVLIGIALAAGANVLTDGNVEVISTIGSSLSTLTGIEGFDQLADTLTDMDLDVVIGAEDGGISNAILGVAAGLGSGLQNIAERTVDVDVDEDAAIEGITGLDGFELDIIIEAFKTFVASIWEVLPFL
mmetsp:Transcript_19011/g.43573  ORF Transcript_19011/g.43573 Transcript_19011/m.43573 type:complete len:600 (+) Transcript_19011:241-2040(+)